MANTTSDKFAYRIIASLPSLTTLAFTNNLSLSRQCQARIMRMLRNQTTADDDNQLKAIGIPVLAKVTQKLETLFVEVNLEESLAIPTLKHLILGKWMVKWEGMVNYNTTEVPRCFPSSLETLVIRCWETPEYVDANLPNLTSLDLTGSNCGLRWTKDTCPKLKTVNLRKARYRVGGLPVELCEEADLAWSDYHARLLKIVQSPNIKKLRLAGLHYQTILPAMDLLTDIVDLNISHSAITGDMIFNLHKLKSLRKLTVTHTQVTEESIKVLKTFLPDLEVKWNPPGSSIHLKDISVPPCHDESSETSKCPDCGLVITTCCSADHQLVCRAAHRPCFNAAEGCPAQLTSTELSSHLQMCSFFYVYCGVCPEGSLPVLRRDWESHALQHDNVGRQAPACPLRNFGCIKEWSVSHSHIAQCAYYKVECLCCFDIFNKMTELNNHVCRSSDKRVALPIRDALEKYQAKWKKINDSLEKNRWMTSQPTTIIYDYMAGW